MLLVDVVMPEMDAFELAARLSAGLPEAKVLYMSGYTDAREEGHFIQKPFLPTSHGFDQYFGLLYTPDMPPLDYVRGETVAEEKIDLSETCQRYTEEALRFIRETVVIEDSPKSVSLSSCANTCR